MIVLVLRALGLGDLLTAVPALRGLARAFPAHRRLLACPAALAPLALQTGAVHDVVPVPPLAALPVHLPPIDVAVNLHGHGPESHRVLLARMPRRLVAFAHDAVAESRGLPRWRPDEREISRWCRMLGECGIPCDEDDLELPPPRGPVATQAIGATLLHPGAASEARRWPVARWIAVARAERARGRRVILSGGPAEVVRAGVIARGAGLDDASIFAGRTDVLGLARLVAAASRVVCGDTGVGHLATALGTPSVLLFGPTPPALWGPPPSRRRHRVLWAGGSGDAHGSRVDPSLLSIEAAEVVAALANVATQGVTT